MTTYTIHVGGRLTMETEHAGIAERASEDGFIVTAVTGAEA